jgi:hypothetical protein
MRRCLPPTVLVVIAIVVAELLPGSAPITPIGLGLEYAVELDEARVLAIDACPHVVPPFAGIFLRCLAAPVGNRRDLSARPRPGSARREFLLLPRAAGVRVNVILDNTPRRG